MRPLVFVVVLLPAPRGLPTPPTPPEGAFGVGFAPCPAAGAAVGAPLLPLLALDRDVPLDEPMLFGIAV